MTPPMTPREKVAPSLSDLLRQAVETMKSWTPEQREAHFEAQKKAWVAAEMAFGDEGTRAVTALASGSGDQAELASLAEAATPGPWETHPEAFSPRTFVIPTHHASDDPAVGSILSRQDAAFIAAANPATVLALLAEIAALRGANDVLEVERIGLRSAIFGSNDYDPALRHGNFIEMARTTEDARKGALNRATEAERKLAEAVALLRDAIEPYEHISNVRAFEVMKNGTATRLAAIRTFLSKEGRTWVRSQ